jgi:hypothetical protein
LPGQDLREGITLTRIGVLADDDLNHPVTLTNPRRATATWQRRANHRDGHVQSYLVNLIPATASQNPLSGNALNWQPQP